MDHELRAFRRSLHAAPELSDHEARTARSVVEMLRPLAPNQLWTGLGGHGVAAEFAGAAAGPTVLVRCELDALPIAERSDAAHRSSVDGVAHLCGHDGHMAIVLGLARRLAVAPPARGRAIVLFQPAEETGAGARRVVADPRFAELAPDHAFALHNLPGYPRGAVVVREGTFSCASRGLAVTLRGATSHAAHPEDGRSPAAAMCRLIAVLEGLPRDSALAAIGFTLVTVVHARLGEVAFGTAPGEAVVMATLRATTDAAMDRLAAHADAAARGVAAGEGLDVEIGWRDVFDATVNDAAAVARVRAAADALGLERIELATPFRWSEDFGALAKTATSAMFGLGAGTTHPQLHAENYDFPDELLDPGVAMFERIVRNVTA